MSVRRISWVQLKRRSLQPKKIVVSATKAPTANPTGNRKLSHESVIYGRLLEESETEVICKRLGMTREDVRQLRRKFDDEDGSHSDSVTIRCFFHLINEDKAFERSHILTKELLRLANTTTTTTRVTFDQFLRVVCIFASFSDTQIWRFWYDAFFAGGVDTVNARRLGEVLQAAGVSYARNIGVAARSFGANAVSPLTGLPSTLTFEDFQELVRRNPVIFFPLVQFQRSVRAKTLGEKYWERKEQEQQLVAPLLVYLNQHNGELPRVRFKDWIRNILPGSNTVMSRARTLAWRQYQEDRKKT